jgi:hypothetical protein
VKSEVPHDYPLIQNEIITELTNNKEAVQRNVVCIFRAGVLYLTLCGSFMLSGMKSCAQRTKGYGGYEARS